MPLGVNLCFAVKRMPEPERWAAFVRDDLGLDQVQFTFDLLDPWSPEPHRSTLARRVAAAARTHDLTIHSAFIGLAHYVPSGLLGPDPDGRAVARRWWSHAIATAAELGAGAVGGPAGTISDADFTDQPAAQARQEELLTALAGIAAEASAAGLTNVLIEPTPIAREYPATVTDCQRLLSDLADNGVHNLGLTLDTGHVTYQPLHGPHATIRPWLEHLAGHIRQIHLDNTDGLGDPHWGWPDPRGVLDVPALAASLHEAGLHDVSVMLEVYPRFEDDSARVRDLIISSVEHCRRHFPPLADIADRRKEAADATAG